MTVTREYEETPESRPRTMQEVQCDACPAVFTRSFSEDYRCQWCNRDLCVKHPKIEGDLRIHVSTPSDNYPNMTTQVMLSVGFWTCLDCIPDALNRKRFDKLISEAQS